MYYNTSAIILSRQLMGQNDLLITTYSRHKGKLSLQARGAKRIKSKMAGHLEPISLSLLDIVQGKSYPRIIGVKLVDPYFLIKTDLKLIAYASYFAEILDGLTKNDEPDPNIFSLAVKSLNFLNHTPPASYLVIARIAFGFKLLNLLGFNPALKLNTSQKSLVQKIIRQEVSALIGDEQIKSALSQLNRLLDTELNQQLEKEIKSRQLLYYIAKHHV